MHIDSRKSSSSWMKNYPTKQLTLFSTTRTFGATASSKTRPKFITTFTKKKSGYLLLRTLTSPTLMIQIDFSNSRNGSKNIERGTNLKRKIESSALCLTTGGLAATKNSSRLFMAPRVSTELWMQLRSRKPDEIWKSTLKARLKRCARVSASKPRSNLLAT